MQFFDHTGHHYFKLEIMKKSRSVLSALSCGACGTFKGHKLTRKKYFKLGSAITEK